MPLRPGLPLALLASLTLLAAPAQAIEVTGCEVDVGQCAVMEAAVGIVQACVDGETDLCNTEDNVVQDCLQFELPACALAWNQVQSCLEGPNSACREVDACVDGEEGLCKRVIDEVGTCVPLGDGSDVCDDAWNLFLACGEPGAPCWLVAGVIIECLGNDYQPSPVPCEVVWAHIDACLANAPGLCTTAIGLATACSQSRYPCPVRVNDVRDCAVELALRRVVCDDL